jgi:hypothetical protein
VDEQPGTAPRVEPPTARTRAQWTLVGLIVALALGVVAYRLLHAQGIDETAALFIGLPTLLAVALALTPKATSATGMIMKGLTIALLLSGPVLREGFICILLASPLFYLVGAIVGWAVDSDRRRRSRGRRPLHSLAILPLILMSVEGLTPSVSLPTDVSVGAARSVAARSAAVEARLAAEPRFAETLPPFLRIGFPRPTGAEGGGLAVGDTRTIYFGQSGAPRRLVFVVAERAPGYVRFRAVSDDTKIGTWLTWRDAEVRWTEGADGRTDVTWTLRFSRRLSPGWYFGPLESAAAAAAAEYLIDSLATP